MQDNELYVAEILTGLDETRFFLYRNLQTEIPVYTAKVLAQAFGGEVIAVCPAAGFITGGHMCEIVRA